MIEQITFENKIISIVIKSNYKKEGITIFTLDDFSQQLGYMNIINAMGKNLKL